MSETTTVTIGNRTFELDKTKAEEAFAAKRIINGKDTMFFNILPLKYQWAYDQYRTMKNNHWEPEDVIMQKDIEQWRGNDLSDVERWIVKMAIGYFSAAEGIVGDNILHVVRHLVTAPELKLMLGRHAHEENIHADSLVYMISSLGINPHECEAMFEDIPSIKAKTEFVVNNSKDMRHIGPHYLEGIHGKQALAKNIFLFGQVMEGTQFYGLFCMLLGLYRQNKFPGIGTMFRYTLRDECLTEDHELLTPKGWVRIPDLALELDEAPEVAQYHEDGTITFTPFTNPTVSEVDHTWQFANEQGHIDLQVSDNHRMVMRTIVAESRKEEGGRVSRLKIEAAKDCRHNPYSAHVCAGKLNNPAAQMTELNDVQRLLIAYQADGRTPREACDGSRAGHVMLHFEFKRLRKIHRLLALLERLHLPAEYGPSADGKTMITVRVSPELAACKRFGWVDLSRVNSKWCAEFIDELSYWDGHRVGGGDNRITWGNTDKSDVDIVQTIAVLAGYRTHYKFIEDTRYEPAALYHRLQIVRNRDYFRGNKITKTKIEGKELVYGVTVPTGMLLVRRNNAIGVTGNSQHIKNLKLLFQDLVRENPEIMTKDFREDLLETMAQGVELEKTFIRDCLPVTAVGLNVADFELYIDYIADRRLVDIGLPPLTPAGRRENPFPWMAEMIDIKKETNFFEGRVTEYQKSSALSNVSDDDL